MFKKLKEIWGITTLRKKIIFMILMLAVIRLGNIIPTPGVKPEALSGLFSKYGDNFGLIDSITGGALKKMAIFALGVLPYINASIIMNLVTIAIPAMEKMSKEEDGRKKIAQITRYFGMGLAAISATGLLITFRASGLLVENSMLIYTSVVATLTAGTAILVWLGDRITEGGLGNGTSFIIFANILSNMPETGKILWSTLGKTNPIGFWMVILFIVLLLAFVVYVNEGERRIQVDYAKKMAGRSAYGIGNGSFIPIKVNLSGVLPLIFAVSVVQFPELMIKTFNFGGIWVKIGNYLSLTHPVGATIYILLIFFFAYFYSTIQFNPLEFSENLKKSGGTITGIRPGASTSEYIRNILSKITFVGAGFLSVIAIVPILMELVFKTKIAFGGTSLLIAVGVAMEVLRQVEAHMISKNYQGFIK